MSKCLVDGCEGNAEVRGLCPGCYYAAYCAVLDGLVSWHQLESVGMALPQRSDDKFYVMLKEKGIAMSSGDRKRLSVCDRVMQFIADEGGSATRREVMRRFKLQVEDLNDVAYALTVQGLIEVTSTLNSHGPATVVWTAVSSAPPATDPDAGPSELQPLAV